MKQAITLLFPIIFLTSCYDPSAMESINDLKKISGSWESYKEVEFNENWEFVNENLFIGEGFSLNGTDTAFYEKLKIEKVGDSIYYNVYFAEANNPVKFSLTKASKNKWVFKNPNNDYPSIIIYHLHNDTLLTVTTANIRGNKEQFFYLKKVN